MKRKNNTLLTLMLAGMLCAATAGTVAAARSVNASADTTAKSYELTKVFNSNGTTATITGKKVNETDETRVAALTMNNNNSVEFNRNLAIKWFTAKDQASYTTMKFTFGDLNFTEMEFVFESVALNAAKDNSAVNKIKFTKGADNKVSVKVLNGDDDGANVAAEPTTIAEKSTITISLTDAGCDLGEYTVNLKVGDEAAAPIGTFTNVGAKYFLNGTNDGNDLQAMVVNAKTNGTATVLFVEEINGQSFRGITDDNKVKDTAAPVLVVNDDVRGFLLGTQFELDFKEIDVLDDSLTSKKSFYQWNPTDTAVAMADNSVDFKNSLVPNSTTGTYFMDTIVYANADNTAFSKEAQDGYTKTTVYRVFDEEYVAIRFTLEDDTFTGTGEDTHKKASYDLSWYADASAVATKDLGEVETHYVVLNRNAQGPEYNLDYTDEQINFYNDQLKAKADKASAGSNEYVNLPSLAWLISDIDNGYQTLQFTISYKTPGSSSAKTTSNVDPKGLKISVDQAGMYEFKVFASDAAGNATFVDKLDKEGRVEYMKDEHGAQILDENGQPIPLKVKVTTANIWDLKEIPSFSFSVKGQGMKADDGEDSDPITTKIIGETYSMTDVTIVGAEKETSLASLYKLDLGKYTGSGTLAIEKLSGIKYNALQEKANELMADAIKGGATASTVDRQAIAKQAYINLIAEAIGGEVEKVAEIFVAIDEFDSRISEEENAEAWANSDNKYNWNADSKSFTTAESGLYIIVVSYWDAAVPGSVNTVPAYQLIEVESEADVIKGETEWLKKNLVSVILFSVAAVMLILIIILLLVKPSDETLEDVDKKIISKRKEATDKHKKN